MPRAQMARPVAVSRAVPLTMAEVRIREKVYAGRNGVVFTCHAAIMPPRRAGTGRTANSAANPRKGSSR